MLRISPDQVHEHVGCGYVTHLALADDGIFGPLTRMDSQYEDDAQDDGTDGGTHVVDDGPGADTSRDRQVQRSHGRDHRRHDQWQN